MTGFAREEGAFNAWRWTWELKSVNGRGLELRFRLPPGYDELEPGLRKTTQAHLKRGSVYAGLVLQTERGEAKLQVNEAALGNVLEMLKSMDSDIDWAPPRREGILALRGVLETTDTETSGDDRAALIKQLSVSFAAAMQSLATARQAEGVEMSAVINAQFDEIERLTALAAQHAEATPKVIHDRLVAQLTDLLSGSAIPEERLAQEAALLAVKADIREELDRLKAHIAAGRALLTRAGAVGRELDFLTQEFNRETNTLCSKAQDMDLKHTGLELKKVIDQLREQVQNIE